MELVGRTIYGESRYLRTIDDKCVIYCTTRKTEKDHTSDFVVGIPGGNAWMEREEAKEYRLGIEGSVDAYTGKHADFVGVNFYEKDAYFADFYTEEGEIIKKMLIHNNKFYMFDGEHYYEVSSDADKPSTESHEVFICKDEEHEYLQKDIISKKEKFSKIFLEMFESLQ